MSYTTGMKRGFTFTEILIIIAILGILASIVTVSIPAVRAKQRNAQRATDTSLILHAIYQYALDNSNQLPTAITNATTTICRTSATSCRGAIDLGVLTQNQKYIVAIPTDPLSTSTVSTGYSIMKNAVGRVTISAPSAEAGSTILITR